MNRHFWHYCLLVSAILAIVATLTPFDFVVPQNIGSPTQIFEQFRHSSTVKDYWQNILLFLPFGISLAAVLSSTKLNYTSILIVSIVASFCLSLLVETLQFFLPIRVSNFSDVATNTIGGLLGTSLYWWRDLIVSLITSILGKNRSEHRLKSFITVFICYFLAICLATYVILININLSNWNDDFYLVIGNEASGDRPWRGNIKSLQISDRAISFSEIKRTFSEEQIPSFETDYSVYYLFDRQQEKFVSSRDTADVLVWQETPSISNSTSDLTKNDSNSVTVSGDRWLISQTPADKLTNTLQKSGQFTLSAILATALTQQIGPARIISLSKNIIYRNFTIGQEQNNLIFRLRSPVTGDNGSQPELVIPQVFHDTNFHHLIITFQKNRLDFYIDSEENKYSFFFQPEINFLAYYPFTILNWQINLANFKKLKYYLAFYGIAFIPLGIIGRFILSLVRNNAIVKAQTIIIICFIPPLVFELFYSLTAFQPLRELNLLLGILLLSITTIILSRLTVSI